MPQYQIICHIYERLFKKSKNDFLALFENHSFGSNKNFNSSLGDFRNFCFSLKIFVLIFLCWMEIEQSLENFNLMIHVRSFNVHDMPIKKYEKFQAYFQPNIWMLHFDASKRNCNFFLKFASRCLSSWQSSNPSQPQLSKPWDKVVIDHETFQANTRTGLFFRWLGAA